MEGRSSTGMWGGEGEGERLEEREQFLGLAHALARVTQAVDLLDDMHDDGVHGACMGRAGCTVDGG